MLSGFYLSVALTQSLISTVVTTSAILNGVLVRKSILIILEKCAYILHLKEVYNGLKRINKLLVVDSDLVA